MTMTDTTINASSFLFQITETQRKALLENELTTFESIFGEDDLQRIRKTFDEQGVVIVRDLLDENLLTSLERDAQSVVDQPKGPNPATFTTLKFAPVLDDNLQSFREVAINSAVPRFVSKILLPTDSNNNENLRVLKDAFLAKGKEERCCGWHVDDMGFWPVSARSSPGVNAWIALDDMPASHGGGLAVSPGSHKADEWRHEAYKVIGSTRLHPEEGFETMQELLEKARPQTCDMIVNAPELESRIESTKYVADFQKGDVLFHTRWLFHRSMKINEEGLEHLESVTKPTGATPVLKRYSIRYEPGTARLLNGYSMEKSVLVEPKNAGRTLDEVGDNSGPWYPRCFADEREEIRQLVEEKMPIAEAIIEGRMKEFKNQWKGSK